jgi:pimeloyl-ACP methyl ester carboxylesterase
MKWLLRIVAGLVAVAVIAFLIFRTPDTDPDAMRAKYGGEPSQFVTLADGQGVHLRDEGPDNGNTDAPAIILLHGSNADLHTWQPWVDALKSDYRVIRYDQIGHGLTGPSQSGTYRLQDFTADVGQVADHLGLDGFVLGGNSMGGWIAAGYALENPGRLEGLVLVDASGSPVRREQGSSGNIGFTIAAMPGVNRLMESITPRSLVEQSLRQSVSNQAVATPEAIDRYWELLRYPGNRAATVARFNTPRVTYSEEQIAALNVPALVMWGAEDALIPAGAADWYHAHLPDSTKVIYPDIGHLPMEENAAQSAADLRAWLERLEARKPVSGE